MPLTLAGADWDAIRVLRESLEARLAEAGSFVDAAQRFAAMMRTTFDTIVLSRVFLVVPFSRLPATEQAWATGSGVTIPPRTPTLCLMGTSGVEAAWNDRRASAGHRVIPLTDPAAVAATPMLAALFSSLNVELTAPAGAGAVELRPLPGGLNSRFFVADAPETRDAQGRHIIAAREFVATYGIRTVFGMGGSYVGGALAAAIFFTREALKLAEVDRYASLIGGFKLATASFVTSATLW